MIAAPHSAIATALHASPLLFALVQTVHIIGFSILVGASAIFAVRILGAAKRIGIRELNGLILPWVAVSLLLIVPSGLAMFATHANELIGSRSFFYKILLLFAALINALIFYSGAYQTSKQWNQDLSAPAGAKGSAALSLLLWFAIITCGRMLRLGIAQ